MNTKFIYQCIKGTFLDNPKLLLIIAYIHLLPSYITIAFIAAGLFVCHHPILGISFAICLCYFSTILLNNFISIWKNKPNDSLLIKLAIAYITFGVNCLMIHMYIGTLILLISYILINLSIEAGKSDV